MTKQFKGFIRPAIITITIFLFLRIFEFILTKDNHFLPFDSAFFELLGFIGDIALILGLTFLLFCLLLPLSFVSKKLPVIVFKTLLLLICLAYIPLIEYFSILLYPLDGVLFKYSLNEIIFILNTGTSFGIVDFLPFIVVLIIFFGLNYFLKYKSISHTFSAYFLLACFLSVPLAWYSRLGSENFNKKISFYLFSNKITYLIAHSEFKEVSVNLTEIDHTAKRYSAIYPNKQFNNNKYPLLHTNSYPNVLEPYFNLSPKKPNIVFLMVESLSRLNFGNDARCGNFTPFLDSLSHHCLYWKNFLSATERTFGVLPSSLGSLPFGKKGFMALDEKTPKHLSLPSILKNNNYYVSFFQGTNIAFDNMKSFMVKQGVDQITKGDYYERNGKVYWGLRDEEVYNRSFELIDSLNISLPRLDIYLTLSSHGPIDLPDMDGYESRVKEIIENNNKLSKNTKENSLALKEHCMGILYTDDQLRNFFKKYQARNDYENTIFILFGDHGISALDPDNVLSKYHIPLLIYSPLLKKTQTFEGVSSQLDIAPSLLSLLGEKYNLNVPENVHWLGNSLDTSVSFQSNISLPFMNVARSCEDYIFNNYFISSNELFKIEKDLKLKRTKNDTILERIKSKLDLFKEINAYTCNYDKILPEGNFKLYGQNKKLIVDKKIFIQEKDSIAEFITLYDIENNNNYNNFSFVLEGDFFSAETDKNILPSFVVASDDLDSESLLSYQTDEFKESADGNPIKSKQWTRVLLSQNTGIILNEKLRFKTKLYLWNSRKTPVYFKNLSLKVYGIPN